MKFSSVIAIAAALFLSASTTVDARFGQEQLANLGANIQAAGCDPGQNFQGDKATLGFG
ncbi:hypothetical protein HDU67_008783, partial [Dinochytrium kinnereticum]